MTEKEIQTEFKEWAERCGGHPALLDALADVTKRYLDEHPHVGMKDLRVTADLFHTVILRWGRLSHDG
jgi:hypothetical protein